MRRLLTALSLALAAAALHAQPEDRIGRVETRPGVRVSYFAVWRSDAVATLVMFSGGGGGFGRPDPATGWTDSNNFVIRTAPAFARAGPFNVVLMGRASDVDALEYEERASPRHLQDNLAVLRVLKQRSPLPLWLVGTSRGTISAAAVAVGDTERLVDGLVLSSSVVDYGKPGAVPRQDLARIRVPTLVVHHRHDACRVTPASGVPFVLRGLTGAPVKASLLVTGGEDQATGDPCSGLHTHGYRGIEAQVVEGISGWILRPESR